MMLNCYLLCAPCETKMFQTFIVGFYSHLTYRTDSTWSAGSVTEGASVLQARVCTFGGSCNSPQFRPWALMRSQFHSDVLASTPAPRIPHPRVQPSILRHFHGVLPLAHAYHSICWGVAGHVRPCAVTECSLWMMAPKTCVGRPRISWDIHGCILYPDILDDRYQHTYDRASDSHGPLRVASVREKCFKLLSIPHQGIASVVVCDS
ncbi:hypothetical protein BD309DRAFT_971331 [Dichomitus squalens]|nr:hypothetical protein BD309DRAFT_971331 [Dichomitus squalens]